jgi:hypothetical protein
MSLSDRERAEGFLVVIVGLDSDSRERAEGFPLFAVSTSNPTQNCKQ